MTNYKDIQISELFEKEKYWYKIGEFHATPIIREQSMENSVNSFHSRTRFSIDDMTKENRLNFDNALTKLFLLFQKKVCLLSLPIPACLGESQL